MKIVESFKNRLNEALTVRDLKPIELAEKTKSDKGKISKYLKGVYKAKLETIQLFAEALNVNPVWLAGYDVPMEIEKKVKTNKITVPILGTVKAGYDYLAKENWIGEIDVTGDFKNPKDLFALMVKGDSMQPVIMENDIVIVKKQNDFETNELVVAIINGEEATIKKAKKIPNGILLQPFNDKYDTLVFTDNDINTIPIQIIGIVKELKRKF